jgi:signal transduction histidine kinase
VSEFAWLVEVLDPTGRAVLLLPDILGQPRSARPPPPGFLNYEVPARERFSGEVLGTLRVQFRTDALVDRGAAGGGITGSVLAVVDRRTGISLTSLPVDPEIFNRERFMWGEEGWLSIGREVVDPPIRLIMAAPLGPVTAPLEEAARQGTMALLLVVVGTFVLATLFSHWLTRSLEGLSTAAGGLAAGDLNAQVEETGPPEVRETAAAFNAMSATLRQTLDHLSQKEALAAVGEFAASLAHEVRNPLTSVRMDIERCAGRLEADPVQARVLADRALVAIDRLNASVTGILRVSRIGGGVLGPVDLRLPLEAAVRAAAPRFKEQGCVLHFETPPAPIEVVGDLGSLEQLVLNLLLNAAEARRGSGHPPGR